MGNTQSSHSAQAPRKPTHRLSKPRTGNHAAPGFLSPKRLSNATRRHTNSQLPDPPLESPIAATTPASSVLEVPAALGRRANNNNSSQPSSGSKRRSLFRPGSSKEAVPSLKRLSGRFSRTSSMTYESAVAYYGPETPNEPANQPDVRASWHYNLTSYEARRLFNQTDEPAFEHMTAMSENRMSTITAATWKSSHPAVPASAPLTRTNSDVSLYAPVRRRSIIQTPGVATREIYNRELPPLPQPSFRHSDPPSPMLSRRSSIESYQNGVLLMPPHIPDTDSVERVSTPCEDGYRSIGAFKLGSLRIVNGSPVPSTPETARTREKNEAHGLLGGRIDSTAVSARNADSSAPGSATQQTQLPQPSLNTHQDLFASPVQPQPISPTLQVTSKVTALEDKLFEDELPTEYSSAEILDVRLDPNAKSSHPREKHESSKIVSRSDSGFLSMSEGLSVSTKGLSKADSGYSSNVSLRSFQTRHQMSGKHSAPTPPPKQDHNSEDSPPPPPPKDRSNESVIQKKTGLASLRRSHPGSPTGLTSRDSNRTSPVSGPLSPGSSKSPTSDTASSEPSNGNGIKKLGRLQRLFTNARRPGTALSAQPTSQPLAAPPAAESSKERSEPPLPPLPQENERKRNERARMIPPAKKPVVKTRSSLDTLKTIFSVGSLEHTLETTNSKQTSPQPNAKDHTRKPAVHLANLASHVVSKKPITRKPVPSRPPVVQEGEEKGVKYRVHRPSPLRVGVTHKNEPTQTTDGNSSRVVTDAQANRQLGKSEKRAMSLTMPKPQQAEDPQPRVSSLDLVTLNNLPSPPLPSPVAKAMSINASAQGWSFTPDHQPLRHRASYDGLSYIPPRPQPHPKYGYPPSMSTGYTSSPYYNYSNPAAYDDERSRSQLSAAAIWSRSQADAAAGQWYQYNGWGHRPPYWPRSRHRSAYGPNPPFRILHSYNSPAYRGVPIWG
ncbi:uncharacterized protein CTHT_0012970 [Thermochaetoides thermophila DSM 1495]|uniref:Uncharacterized protein n=1 Tax=Chaetomium thermophilum (strain DSM 1495 / CBS 144.50 / IMI 039719) TaxID=759272 RepID=G0S1B1_CHATD|nr:hypothetical protein CTHT_0012970 [Thermochaetoides thermophila DSM 1495]EGS22821.1 hypothetical protein CTHT_0012970 [Thermochaetoides thermophila DSM 1495]